MHAQHPIFRPRVCAAPDHFQTHQSSRRRRTQKPPPRAQQQLFTLLDVASTSLAAFEPRADPAIAVAAACAAVPPLVFWGRIAISESKRRKKLEEEERIAAERERTRLVRDCMCTMLHRRRSFFFFPLQELMKNLFGKK